MSSGFTNTFILEANRLSSEEVKSGNDSNNALFTNKVNDGLKLNTGDVVGVHSAYISELGAEGSDIEIKGRELDRLNASQILNYNIISNEKFEGSSAVDSWLEERDDIVNKFPLTRRVDVNERINYRDDEINMVMNPYKNANGEYYIPLPYRYSMEFFGSHEAGLIEQIKQWDRPCPNLGLNNTLTGSASKTFGNASIGNLTRKPRNESYNLADIREYNPDKVTLPNASTNVCIRHDNSRYSLYQLKNCVHLYPLTEYIDDVLNNEYLNVRNNALKGIPWDEEAGVSISNGSYEYGLTKDEHFGNPYWRDIAPREYVRVKNKVNCSVTAGYNSNTDIANKLTEDMLRTEEIEKIGFEAVNFSLKAENQVNKLYNTATIGTFAETGYKDFNDQITRQGDQDRFYYIEAHETIGVKRPELYDLGRAFATKSEGYSLRFDYFPEDEDENASGLIYTDIPWEKVQDLKNLVDAQHQYPELFDTGEMATPGTLSGTEYLIPNASVGRSGFLHININKDHKFLGYDLVDNASTYWATNIPEIDTGVCPNHDFCSVPFFFDINSSTSEMAEGKVATGQNWENAVYGFAVKTFDSLNQKYYIGLQSNAHYNLGGYTNASGLAIIPENTKIGWDYHFNAYGCPCMLLWNGFCGNEGVGYQGYGIGRYIDPDDDEGVPNINAKIETADKVNQIYVGSPNVEISFDDASDRFEILKLHTSEVIGNLYNAGYQAEDLYEETNASGVVVFTNPDEAVPENDNATTRVYKINKQLTKTNFTPAMAPYLNEVNASFYTRYTDTNNASYTAQQRFEYPNNNFVIESIFDSQCGNFIVDWGMNEKYWNESLWGVMGFRYSQSVGKGNTQTRVINSISWGDSVDGMDENTTNADITNADFDSLTRNMFNIKTFGLTPPVPQTPRWYEAEGNGCHTFAPPINITQTNGQPLRALEIPTRTLRPYYTIRSNITGQARYFGSSDSSIPLPVVAVVEKVSQSGDFFNLSSGRLQFTITQPMMLTDITTSIHDPDGSYSKVSPNSAVLYQVERKVNADMNVVSTILQEEPNKKATLQFEESLDNPQPTKKDINDVINQMKS